VAVVAVFGESEPVLLDLVEGKPVLHQPLGQRQGRLLLEESQVVEHLLVQGLVLVVLAVEEQERVDE
jgi:hypothetical protein